MSNSSRVMKIEDLGCDEISPPMDIDHDTSNSASSPKLDHGMIIQGATFPLPQQSSGEVKSSDSLRESIFSGSTPSFETQQLSEPSAVDTLMSGIEKMSNYWSLADDKAYLEQILNLQLSNSFSTSQPLFTDHFEKSEYARWTVSPNVVQYGEDGIIGAPKEMKEFIKWLKSGDEMFLDQHRQCCEVMDLLWARSDNHTQHLSTLTTEHLKTVSELQNDQIFLEQLLAGAIVDSGLVCLIGPRNSGKSHLLCRVLEKLANKQNEAQKTNFSKEIYFPAPLLPIRVIVLHALQTQDPFDLLLYIWNDLREIVEATKEESDTIEEIKNSLESATNHMGSLSGDALHKSRLYALREKYSSALTQTMNVIKRVTSSRQLVIVLEDFDLLAGERQTFLYNLMDIISNGYKHNNQSSGTHGLLADFLNANDSPSTATFRPLDEQLNSHDEILETLKALQGGMRSQLVAAQDSMNATQHDVQLAAKSFKEDIAALYLSTPTVENVKNQLSLIPLFLSEIDKLIERWSQQSEPLDEDLKARAEVQAMLATTMGISIPVESGISKTDVVLEYNAILDKYNALMERSAEAEAIDKQTMDFDDPSSRITTTPITAVMVTSRLDSFSMLEKRVSSRFPQRQIIVTGPRSLNEMMALLFQHLIISDIPLPPERALLVERRKLFREKARNSMQTAQAKGIVLNEEAVFDAYQVLNHPLSLNDITKQEDDDDDGSTSDESSAILRDLKNPNSDAYRRVVAQRAVIMEWNTSVMKFFRATPPSTWALLESVAETTLNVAHFYRIFLDAIAETAVPLLSPKSLERSLEAFINASSRIEAGLSLSPLQIILLVEMNRLEQQIMYGWEKSGNPFVDIHLPTEAMAVNLGTAQLLKGKRKANGTQPFLAEPSVAAARQDRLRLQNYHFERLYSEYYKWISTDTHLKAYKLPQHIVWKEFQRLLQMRFVSFSGSERYHHYAFTTTPEGYLASAYHYIKLAISGWELEEILQRYPEALPESVHARLKL